MTPDAPETPDPRDAPEPPESLLPTREGMQIMRLLDKHGNSMRLKPLLRALDMDTGAFVAAANDLKERYWITLVWRKAPPGMGEVESRPHTEIDRLVVTWFGRLKYRKTWWMVG
jgi:hypothetical protein